MRECLPRSEGLRGIFYFITIHIKEESVMATFKVALQEVNPDHEFLFADYRDGLLTVEDIMKEVAQFPVNTEFRIIIDDEKDLPEAENLVKILELEEQMKFDVSEIFSENLYFEMEGAAPIQVAAPSSYAAVEEKLFSPAVEPKKNESQKEENKVALQSAGVMPNLTQDFAKENKKEEKNMNLVSAGVIPNLFEGAVENKNQEEKKMALKSAGSVQVNQKNASRIGRRTLRLKASAVERQKFEGPWYLNKSLYPVLERLGRLVKTFKDEQLGITDIYTVNPGDLGRKKDFVAVQIKFGEGVTINLFLDLIVRDGKKMLRPKNVVWKRNKAGKLYPVFVTWRTNKPQVKVTCVCGKQEELYVGQGAKCGKCGNILSVDLELKFNQNVKYASMPPYVAQSLGQYAQVSKDVLVMALAFAHYAEGLPMYGWTKKKNNDDDPKGPGGGGNKPASFSNIDAPAKQSTENAFDFMDAVDELAQQLTLKGGEIVNQGKFRLIVAGTRTLTDYNLVKRHLDYIASQIGKDNLLIVSGGAKGADALGELYARQNGIELKKFPAEWNKYGKKAGPIRNAQMADFGHGLLAFWDGKSPGTKNMIDLAKKKGLWVSVIRYQ